MSQSVVIKADLVKLGSAVQLDAAVNDSDKSFTVPAGEEWDVLSVRAELTTTATIGNRRMAVEAQDGSTNVLARVQAGAVQAASLTVNYNFAPGLADQAAVVGSDLNTALPCIKLGPGMILRVYDIAVIDAAADDVPVRVLVDRRKV